jgi:NAD(P)-dependent dehydrogenase (short-subunit alcohol dehydrogenase family)
MGTLSGRVALITGAGRGFGEATAALFAEHGAHLALNYRASQAGCEAIAERAREAGQRAITVQADMREDDQINAMVERVLGEFGRVDILVNNAGVLYRGPFHESGEQDWRDEIEVNIFGPLRLTRALLPSMIEAGGGRIINLSSQLAPIGGADMGVYSGTKGFILSWTKSLAREVGRYNINVNAIGPGSIVTDMNIDLYPTEAAQRRRAEELPLRRLGSPRDVAECALFLASDAGNFLTGQMLSPNGGNMMQ